MTSTTSQMVRIVLLFAIFLSIGAFSTVSADELIQTSSLNYTQERAAPVIVLIEYDPWRLVIGADSPSFALYNNGFVIFWNEDHYQSVVLNSSDYDALLSDLNIGDSFFELDDYYDLALATDQPSNIIHVWRDGERKTVSVYGDLVSGDYMEMGEVPPSFLHLFEVMKDYETADAQDWFPERIEVLLWSTSGSNGVEWPADFPALNSEFAVRRDADQFSVFVESSQVDHLRELYDESSTMLINGTAWSFSWRLPFPIEYAWQNRNSAELPLFTDIQSEMETFGAGVLDKDEWALSLSNAYAENNFLSAVATWTRDESVSTAIYSQQLMRSPFADSNDLSAAIDNTWLATEWMDFDKVTRLTKCVESETVIFDLSLTDQDGLEMLARYWVWQNDVFLNEFKVIVSPENTDELETLSDSLFPESPRCPN